MKFHNGVINPGCAVSSLMITGHFVGCYRAWCLYCRRAPGRIGHTCRRPMASARICVRPGCQSEIPGICCSMRHFGRTASRRIGGWRRRRVVGRYCEFATTPVSCRSRQRLATPRAAIGDLGESQLAATTGPPTGAPSFLQSSRSRSDGDVD